MTQFIALHFQRWCNS